MIDSHVPRLNPAPDNSTPSEQIPPNPNVTLVQSYIDRGFRLIFFPTKQKGPSGADAVGWPERTDGIERYVPDSKGQYPNLGTFTGHEIAPGKYLCDIDFDWSDGLPLAKWVLPPTAFGFGRSTRTFSHAFYTSPTPLPSMVFDGIDGKPIVELRGTKADGSIGMQTMLPPSIHPNGEELSIRADGEINHVEDLPRRVTLYAVSCLLYSSFSDRSFLHDVRMATAGFLLTEGLTFDETLMVGTAICEVSGNNAGDFKVLLQSTANKLKQGEKVQGRGALLKSLGEGGAKIVARIKEWLGNEEFSVDGKGKVLANHQDNIRLALEKLNVKLSFDVFSQKPLIDLSGHSSKYVGVLTDAILTELWLEADEKFGFRPSKDFFYDVTTNIANRNKFHPVLDYLNTLTWDGVPRIDGWLIASGGAGDTDYVRAVSSLMLIAAVRRVTSPGCKFDEMVVLESSQQGLMKSTAMRTLCPDPEWFSDDLPLNVDAKQIIERTLGKWIIEASDLSGMHKSRVEQLKGMLSRQVDGPVRLAYGRIPVEQRRQFVIWGTTNSQTYLTDSTGNRRFWPIQIKGFDITWIRENRDQLWAEAYSREKTGESIRLHPSLYALAGKQQERRRTEDPWERIIEEKFPRGVKHRLHPNEMWEAVGIHQVEKRDVETNSRLLRIMHLLGFRRMAVRENGVVVKGFARDVEEGQQELPDGE